MAESDPLVSVVTPSYNSEAFVEETIRSVRDQTYDRVEHVVVDGGSTDGTLDVLRANEDEYDLRWVSEPDDSMYAAIEKGFELVDGDVLAWLNTDDRYFPWTLSVVADVLGGDGPEWITGQTAHMDPEGRLVRVGELLQHYRRSWLRRGWYHGRGLGFVTQECTFWTADLWERCGGFPDGVELAGDYYLWRQFASEADLISLDTVLAARRQHGDQLTTELDDYYEEVDAVGPHLRLMRACKVGYLYSLLVTLLTDPASERYGLYDRR